MDNFYFHDSGNRLDYELLDFGEGVRVERFGKYIIERPSLAAYDFHRSNNKIWNKVDSSFIPENSNGQRGKWTVKIEPWQVELGQVTLELRCTPFGHVGFFAEQITNWLELYSTISDSLERRNSIRVLNLFAYTGGASIASAKVTNGLKKVEVVHVDSAGNVVEWAKRNVALSGVTGVRFIVDDVRKFVIRELRRKKFYDVIILDPPTYGHGTRGETWKFDIDLPVLISNIVGLLSEQPILILITAHTENFDPDMLQDMLLNTGIPYSLKIKKFQMQIKAQTGKLLPSGYGVCASVYNS